MITEKIINKFLDKNVSEAKAETEILLYQKVQEKINELKEEITISTYSQSILKQPEDYNEQEDNSSNIIVEKDAKTENTKFVADLSRHAVDSLKDNITSKLKSAITNATNTLTNPSKALDVLGYKKKKKK